MKKQILFLGILTMISIGAFAQESRIGDFNDMTKHYGKDKRTLVKEYMELTPQEDSLFWPVYDEYEVKRMKLSDERTEIVHEYLVNAKNINDKEAIKMVERGVKMEIGFKKLQKTYFTRLSNLIGPIKAAQFYQFENYLNHDTNVSIQQHIPFVGELEQKRAHKVINN